MIYRTQSEYARGPVRAVVVYCSDGRAVEQCDAFVREGLGIGPCDRLVVPGGPGRLVDASSDAMAQLKFLVEAHRLDRVVLIQHDDCGYYRARAAVSTVDLEAEQEADLVRAVEAVGSAIGSVRIDCYFARQSASGVGFSIVDTTSVR